MSCRVLLVDDDEFARGYVRIVLERAGFEIHEAEDVAGAMTSNNLFHPAVVITDWNLPDGNGGDLARLLHLGSNRLPVILITGDALAVEPTDDDLQPLFTTILQKPFSASAIEKAIREATLQQQLSSP